MRRLFEWIRGASRGGQELSALSGVWGLEVAPVPPGEDWRTELRAAFAEAVAAQVPRLGDAERAEVALGYAAMQMIGESLATSAAIDPSAVETGTLSEPVLACLLSRLLEESTLRPDGRIRLLEAMYSRG